MADRNQLIRHRLTGATLLFVASFLLYSLASPGNIPGDSEIRWSVARQILRNGEFYLEDSMQTGNCAIGAGDRRYSFYGLGQTICMLPFAATGLAIEKLAGINPRISDLTGQFLASVILFPAIGAIVVYVFYRLIIALGYSQSSAILAGSLLAFGTMHFHYSVNTQEQTQVVLLMVLAILLMVKYQQKHHFVYAWLFCCALGMCLIFRLDSAVMIFPIYLAAVLFEVFSSDKKSLSNIVGKWFLAGVLGAGGFIVFCGWYNYTLQGNKIPRVRL